MIRAGSLMYGRWLAQYSPKTVESKTVDKTTCTWPFRAKNRYNVTLANHRAPCVWFVVGFRMYLFLAPKWPDIPVFGKILDSHIGRTNTSVRRTCGECHSSLTDHPPPPDGAGWGNIAGKRRDRKIMYRETVGTFFAIDSDVDWVVRLTRERCTDSPPNTPSVEVSCRKVWRFCHVNKHPFLHAVAKTKHNEKVRLTRERCTDSPPTTPSVEVSCRKVWRICHINKHPFLHAVAKTKHNEKFFFVHLHY